MRGNGLQISDRRSNTLQPFIAGSSAGVVRTRRRIELHHVDGVHVDRWGERLEDGCERGGGAEHCNREQHAGVQSRADGGLRESSRAGTDVSNISVGALNVLKPQVAQDNPGPYRAPVNFQLIRLNGNGGAGNWSGENMAGAYDSCVDGSGESVETQTGIVNRPGYARSEYPASASIKAAA